MQLFARDQEKELIEGKQQGLTYQHRKLKGCAK